MRHMAEKASAVLLSGSAALPAIPTNVVMDRDFIARNQIVERYLAGKLPLKGAQDFERYCRDNPDLLEELRLTDRVHAGLRLLDAGGVALPWEAKPKRYWEHLPVFATVAAIALALGIIALMLSQRLATRDSQLETARAVIANRPLDPPVSTQTLTLEPSRTAPSHSNTAVVGGGGARMADLHFDLSWSRYTAYRVTIDRIDQGRVLVLNNLLRDSNGSLHIALNTSALGPGSYQFAIEGLTLQGETVPQAWATIGIAR